MTELQKLGFGACVAIAAFLVLWGMTYFDDTRVRDFRHCKELGFSSYYCVGRR